MSIPHPTLEDVWRAFLETDRRIQESWLETDRRIQESRLETDRRIQESRLETEQLIKESRLETERLRLDTDRRFQDTDRKIKQVTTAIGQLGGRLGDFIEEMVRPAAVRLFNEHGIQVHEVHRQVTAQRHNEKIEIDLLVINDTDAVAIECKSLLSVDDVNDHLERMEKLKRLLPSYANKRVLGAVAAMVIPEQVASYAERKGLFIIGQSGEQLVIRNSAAFQPRAW